MFGFIKRCFLTAMMFFGCNLSNLSSLEFISMNNQECKVRPKIVNVNSDEPVFFFSFSIKTSKCSGSCNNINNPYAKLCIPDIVKSLNVRVFNLVSGTNETRHIEQHETCKCQSRLDASVCNNKQTRNEDKCKCECKELIDKEACDKEFIQNPSNYECECNKSGDIGEYLDYKNCKCRRKLSDKLAEECTENVEERKRAKITSSEDKNKHKCSSCTLTIVLFSIIFTINVGIGTYCVYYKYINRVKKTTVKESFDYQTTFDY